MKDFHFLRGALSAAFPWSEPWAEVGTSAPLSAPRTSAEPHFRSGIDGAEPAEKKGAEWRMQNHQNNFRTYRKLFPFEWQKCIILILIFERLKNNKSDNKYLLSHFHSR